MKFLIGYTFVFLYMVALIQPIAPILVYKIHNATFIENCIDKWNPEKNCKGKCHLEKQITKNQSKETGTNYIEIDLSKFPFAITNNETTALRRSHIIDHQSNYHIEHSQYASHPEPFPPRV